jgi:ABC-2 type transport system permease protein
MLDRYQTHINLRSLSKSKPISFLYTVKATIIKDLTTKKRYKMDLISEIVRSLMFIGVFSLFAGAYLFTAGVELTQKETLLFFITGFTLVIFDGVALWTPLNSVNTDLYNGTLEYLYSAPNSRMGYYVGNISAAAIFASTIFIPVLIFLIVYGNVSLRNLLFALFVVLAMVSVLVAFGTMFALMAIMWKQVGSLAGILNVLFQFLSGFLIPIDAFPQSIKLISYILPYTYGIDLIRYYIIGSTWKTQFPPIYEWMALLGFILIYWSLAAYMLSKVEKFSKNKGLHLL